MNVFQNILYIINFDKGWTTIANVRIYHTVILSDLHKLIGI